MGSPSCCWTVFAHGERFPPTQLIKFESLPAMGYAGNVKLLAQRVNELRRRTIALRCWRAAWRAANGLSTRWRV